MELTPQRLFDALSKLTELDKPFAEGIIFSVNAKELFKNISQSEWTNYLVVDLAIANFLLDPDKKEIKLSKKVNKLDLELLFKQLIDLKLWEVFLLEMEVTKVLACMELAGVCFDTKRLKSLESTLTERVDSLKDKIFCVTGREFNIDSPKDVREILFRELKLKSFKQIKTGESTDSGVLEQLANFHEAPRLILEYRKAAKALSGFVKPLLKFLGNRSIIRATFNQLGSATGRITCVAPNLQNLPIKTDFGKQIRECLIAREGHILISADYSQIELRVLAHLSGDSELLRCFREGIDVHKLVASKLFNVREPSSTQRDIAKTVNYSVLYGISPWGLAKTLKVSEDDAKIFLNYFFSTFNQVKPYFESLLERARKDNLVRSILGRIRWVKNLKGDKFRRVVLNSPVQGSAADIFKLAMVKVFNGFIERSLKSTIILQIHDELLVECPQNEVEEAVLALKESMENVLKLSVPLKVELGGGKNWLEAKENILQI